VLAEENVRGRGYTRSKQHVNHIVLEFPHAFFGLGVPSNNERLVDLGGRIDGRSANTSSS